MRCEISVKTKSDMRRWLMIIWDWRWWRWVIVMAMNCDDDIQDCWWCMAFEFVR